MVWIRIWIKRDEIIKRYKRKKRGMVERMTLYDGKVGGQFQIVRIHLNQFQLTRRLEALGINEMTVIQKLNAKHRGACIIKVRGTRLAIGKHIAQGIEVVSKEEK